MKKISDEEMAAALISHPTVKEAAASLRVTPKTIYNRMNERDFDMMYSSAKADIIRQATITVNRHIMGAIDTIASIMQDKDAAPALRLQAANSILKTAPLLSARLNELDRIAAYNSQRPSFSESLDAMLNKI